MAATIPRTGIFIFIVISYPYFLANKLSEQNSLTAKSWLVSNIDGHILDGEDVDKVRPIASITKLLTVMVVMDVKPNMSEQLTLTTKLQDRLPAKNQTSQ